MKRIPILLMAVTTTVLCGEAAANSRTSHRTTSHSQSRTTVRSSARTVVHHQPITRTPVRTVTPVTRQNFTRVAHSAPRTLTGASRQVNGHRPAPRGFYTHARRFSHGHWFRHRHSCWGPRCWNSRYNCWCRWCPVTCCYYYWCGPYNCYFPVSYCPTGSYDYPEPDSAAPPPGPGPQATPDQAPSEEPSPDQAPVEEPSPGN